MARSPEDPTSTHSLVVGGEQVDGPVLSGLAPVRFVDLYHLLDSEAQALEETGKRDESTDPRRRQYPQHLLLPLM